MLYTSFSSAYVAMKLMNNFKIRHSISELVIAWCPTQDYEQFSSAFQVYHSKVEWNQFFNAEKDADK